MIKGKHAFPKDSTILHFMMSEKVDNLTEIKMP